MITRPTVLILGAGASIPYKFPSGPDLFLKVCDSLEAVDSDMFKFLHEEMEFGGDCIKDFVACLRTSGRSSVDAFLETREDFMEIGKLAIAACLVPHEDAGILFATAIQAKNWYKHLFEQMSPSHEEGSMGNAVEKFADNNISFITFNYDRSLEHFLHASMKSSYRLSESQAGNIVNQIPIIHLHGALGYLPWSANDKPKRPYDPGLKSGYVDIAAKGIKVISESIDEDPEFIAAHKLIQEAKVIIFVGFGYNRMNLKRLNLDDAAEATLYGTSYGLEKREIKDTEKMIGRDIFLDPDAQEILPFFRTTARLI